MTTTSACPTRPRGPRRRPRPRGPLDARQRRRDRRAVCAALRPALSAPDLLLPEQRVGDPAAYRSHLLHVAPDGAFSLVALVWLPGQATAIHDHLSWCVVGVYEGAEHETRYRPHPDGHLVESGTAVAFPGDVAGLLPPGDIHRVHNTSDTTAISLHVYGADLASRRQQHPAGVPRAHPWWVRCEERQRNSLVEEGRQARHETRHHGRRLRCEERQREPRNPATFLGTPCGEGVPARTTVGGHCLD